MRGLRSICCICLLGCLASCAATGPERNQKLLNLELNQWVLIHQQERGDALQFRRQSHGGSAFDTKRGRLVLFGSDTHGQDWKNTPFFFDPVRLEWTQLYPEDGRHTYRVNEQGLPVAGEQGNRPWTMHTFGAVEYDPVRDELIVASAPLHMVPGRFTNALQHVWHDVERHPTWTLRFETDEWVPLDCEPVHFFPYCTAFDTDRNVVIGHRPNGVFELAGEPRSWTQVVRGGQFGWHTNAVYDSKHKALVVFGSNQNANDVVVYRVESGEYGMMPTPGDRPPEDQHNPMAFHPGIGKTVVMVDRVTERDDRGRATAGRAETWLYDLGSDSWAQVETATLPFRCGMNYNMAYDPGHDVLLLVTGDYRNPTSVWALRLTEKD